MTKKHGPKPNENGSAQKTDNTTTGIVPRSGADPARFPVVDIGASADGLAALEDSDTGTDGSLGID
jgi:chemotaxis response regulator CheB